MKNVERDEKRRRHESIFRVTSVYVCILGFGLRYTGPGLQSATGPITAILRDIAVDDHRLSGPKVRLLLNLRNHSECYLTSAFSTLTPWGDSGASSSWGTAEMTTNSENVSRQSLCFNIVLLYEHQWVCDTTSPVLLHCFFTQALISFLAQVVSHLTLPQPWIPVKTSTRPRTSSSKP